jgi:cell wall-associated NlpC family hydrolase
MGESSGSDGKRDFPKGGELRDYEIKNVRDLATMKDNAVYREMKRGISRYHAVMGVRQRNVKLAELPSDVRGAHASKDGKSLSVYLNSKLYDSYSKSALEKQVRKSYDSGWSARTNKPIQHTITHELAHATWNSKMRTANAKAAGKEISALGRQWLNDKRKKGYGKYGESSVDEFWAEVIAKAVHGNADKYTRRAKAIAKKYKL